MEALLGLVCISCDFYVLNFLVFISVLLNSVNLDFGYFRVKLVRF